jgi:hypothetical protein
MAKPKRTFSADVGQRSTGTRGPDQIEYDLDVLFNMFDPEADHPDGSKGGIEGANIQAKSITSRELDDNAVSDSIVGDRTFDESIADDYSQTGTVTQHLSWLWKYIKSITGENLFASVADTIKNMSSKITANSTAINDHKTSGDHDARYYRESEIDNFFTQHKISGDHDVRYYPKSEVYTKEELIPYLQGGSTVRKVEVFTIVNSNNGDGTFTYRDRHGILHTGELDENGHQIYELQEGNYPPHQNLIEVFIMDTLRRDARSGGLEEIDETHIKLTDPQGDGAEITAVYFERIGVAGEHRLYYTGDNTPPPVTSDSTMWFEVIGEAGD